MNDTAPSLTELALADLDEIWDWIADHSPRAANRFLDRFHDAANLHARFPESGRTRE